MTAVARLGTLTCFLIAGLACGTERPTSPTPVPPATTVQPPPAVPPLADVPVPAGSTRFDFAGPLTYSVRDYTKTSVFVLSPSGTFALHYRSLSTRAYVGTYQQDGDHLIFHFSAISGRDAEGTLDGDSMTVRYSLNMEMSDFENAIYKRVR